MQKKLIVVALAAAFALPTASYADNGNFTFYGVADLSYDFVNTGDGTTTANGATTVTGVSKRVVSSNVSKFGFKGGQDLGDGLSANWQVEQQINIDESSTSNTFANRNSFINVKSEKLGVALFGRHDTPYKFASRKLDMFGDNIGDNRALMGAPKKASLPTPAPSAADSAAYFAGASNQGFELRPNNIFMYTTPTFSGFNAAIAAVNLKEANTNTTNTRDRLISLAVMYDIAPFYGSVAHETHKLESNVTATKPGQDESATRLGFGFKPEGKPFEVTAVYEKTTDNLGALGANLNGHSAAYLGAKYMMGSNAVKLGYGKAGQLANTAITDSGATQVTIGYDHGLSKNTKLYALYSKITNGKGINYGFSQSSGAASTVSGYGTSPSVVSLGVKHSF
jgi:predicted porin